VKFTAQISRLEEQQFIKLLKEGTNQGYGQLLNEYQQKVFNTCISIVPNQDDTDIMLLSHSVMPWEDTVE
jgi:ABC-type transporter MlaC component